MRIDSRSGKKIKMKVKRFHHYLLHSWQVFITLNLSCSCFAVGQWQIDKDATDVAMELGRAEMRAFFNSQF